MPLLVRVVSGLIVKPLVRIWFFHVQNELKAKPLTPGPYEAAVSLTPPRGRDAFLFFLVLIVWRLPVSFQSTSVPSGVSPSFRSPLALRASVPLGQSQMLSSVSGPSGQE